MGRSNLEDMPYNEEMLRGAFEALSGKKVFPEQKTKSHVKIVIECFLVIEC